MNKTKIDSCDLTCNPITGCLRGCSYCYAKRIYSRFHWSFKPAFHPERLAELSSLGPPTEKNNKTRKPWIVKAFPNNWLIFSCSVSDFFAPWTKVEWRDAVLESIQNCQTKHIFQFLTKNPENVADSILETSYPDNVWIGTTVTNSEETYRLQYLKYFNCGVRFVFFEPLLSLIDISDYVQWIDWIVIGKLTGSKRVTLNPYWVTHLLNQALINRIPVIVKKNVEWPEKIQNFPITRRY